VALRVRGLGAQQVQPGALELVERPDRGGRQHPVREVEDARLQAGLGGRERAVGAAAGVARQHDRVLEERRRRGHAAARLRPPGGALELHGDRLVGPGRRCGEVPRPPVRSASRVGRLREREMDRAALLGRRRPVHRRAHQRMAEHDALADHEQPVVGRAGRGPGVDAETLGRAPQQERIPDRLGRGGQQQDAGVIRQRLEAADEALLDPVRNHVRRRDPESAGELGRGHPPRQLEQRQRVAPRLRDDPVPHALVQHELHRRAEERAGVAVAQAGDLQVGDVPELLAGLAGGEHDPDRLRQQAPHDEPEREGGGVIEPLRVVDDAQQLLGLLREQPEHREPDEEPVRRRARAQAEHDLERLALRSGQLLEPVEHRRAQLVQPGERQLHLPLHADRPRDREVRRRRDHVLEQRRLPDPGLAPQDQRAALALAHVGEQRVQHRALVGPPPQALLRHRIGERRSHRHRRS
jgi:hypothetical protein